MAAKLDRTPGWVRKGEDAPKSTPRRWKKTEETPKETNGLLPHQVEAIERIKAIPISSPETEP
jgi:hypothetical protein